MGESFNPKCAGVVEKLLQPSGVARFTHLTDTQKVAVINANGLCGSCLLSCLATPCSALGTRKRTHEAFRLAGLAGESRVIERLQRQPPPDNKDEVIFSYGPYSKKIRKGFAEVGETEHRNRLQYFGKQVFLFAHRLAEGIGDPYHYPLEYYFASRNDEGVFETYRITWADVYSPVCSLAEFLDAQESAKVDAIIEALDATMTSREGYRQLAAADAHMVREFLVSKEKAVITQKSLAYLPLEPFNRVINITTDGKTIPTDVSGVRRTVLDVVNYGLQLYSPKPKEKECHFPFFILVPCLAFAAVSRSSSRSLEMAGRWENRSTMFC